MAAWQPASAVPELAGGAAPSAPANVAPQQYAQPQQYGQPQYGQPQYGQPQYGQPPYGAPMNYAAAGPDQFGKALTAFILSLVGVLCFGIVLGIVAVILGAIALNGMKQSGNPRGRGLAIAAVIIGIIEVPLSLIGIIYMLSQQHY